MAKSPREVGRKRLTNDQIRIAQTVEDAVDLWLEGQNGEQKTLIFSDFFEQRKLSNRDAFTQEIAQFLEEKYLKVGWSGANFDFPAGIITLRG